MTLITLFIASLLLIILMLIAKALELRSQKYSFILSIFKRLDNRALVVISDFKFRVLQVIQTVRYILLVSIPALIRQLVDDAKNHAMREYRNSQEVLMGRKNIVNKGSVSFYLKKIQEDKLNTEKGEIQESI